jgi:hypothetical protein
MAVGEDLVIWQSRPGAFELRGEISGESIGTFDDAALAIEHGIEQIAEDGPGRLRLGRGEFRLARPVRLRSHVQLVGSGPGTRLIVTSDNTQGIGLLGVNVDRVEVRDLMLRPELEGQGVAGLVLETCGQPRVSHVDSVGFGSYGFWLRKENFLPVLESCTASGNRKAGFYIAEHQRGPRGNFPPIALANCTAFAGGIGFDIHRSTVVNIIGCTAYQCRKIGFYLHDFSCSVLLSGCRTFQLGEQALLAEKAYELNATGNIFCWHAGDGLVVRDSGWGVICGNEVIDTGSINPGGPDERFLATDLPSGTPVGCAIRLEQSRGFNVSGNTLFNWPQGRRLDEGIVEDAACYDNRISGNIVNYLSGAAVVSPAGRSHCHHNLIEKEQPYGGDPKCAWIQSYQPELADRFISEAIFAARRTLDR